MLSDRSRRKKTLTPCWGRSHWMPATSSTSVCATALKERAWAAAALPGIALFGALGAVVVAGRSPRGRGWQLMALAAIVGACLLVAGLVWGGVIDRTVGV